MFKKILYENDEILVNLDNVCEVGKYDTANNFMHNNIPIVYYVYIQYCFAGSEDYDNTRSFTFKTIGEQNDFFKKLEKLTG